MGPKALKNGRSLPKASKHFAPSLEAPSKISFVSEQMVKSFSRAQNFNQNVAQNV
jgi:hypothetical protein